jgi:hypothetical protein
MIENPFRVLGIQPTKDRKAISEAYNDSYNKLVINGASEKEFWDLKVACQNCEMYALENGDVDLFTDFDRN